MKGWNRGLNGVEFPDCCKGCVPPKRSIHCHSNCEEYIQAKAKYEVEANAERAARKAAEDSKSVEFLLKKG